MDFWTEIYSYFKQTQLVHLASVDGNKPRLRPVTLIYFKQKFWFATGSNDAKVKQIYNNNNIEFCLNLKGEKSSGYIRGSGNAHIVKNIKDKILIADNIEFIKHFWQDPADPDFVLFNIELQEIEYLPIGQMLAARKKVEQV
ncbi:MAG: pyridoxamine 5'-phosphate oxidase family protein [Candidatus Cloacimonetes bacterium]|nr:pyridoxamine 5'-phosphate oxidase family protein [Candidatus Cloacimonadota bacterium]MCF7813276.1 pyridoxamine 5'-phosphate oxidase family protein [Candidatus Cloacimonadota bacterium]MCF7867351.1 pyridoxamine 5'-phosphate oxidase family protein [Candidatus Cloacimonadota bacterium]MCF7882785.1 pyridoxamine 5'-phosphate oxidase family protein [Candidatus Cloacimonadota bacterium]